MKKLAHGEFLQIKLPYSNNFTIKKGNKCNPNQVPWGTTSLGIKLKIFFGGKGNIWYPQLNSMGEEKILGEKGIKWKSQPSSI
jgi:hypothetical protein